MYVIDIASNTLIKLDSTGREQWRRGRKGSGPAEFRLSRWNSFALAEKAEGKKPKLSLDPVADWSITGARVDGGRYVFQIKDYEKPGAAVTTIHLEPKANGEFAIPEWKRTYVRCTGFQSRS